MQSYESSKDMGQELVILALSKISISKYHKESQWWVGHLDM